MYSSLFRELYAARLPLLDMNSTEPYQVTPGATETEASGGDVKNDVIQESPIYEQDAILAQQLKLMENAPCYASYYQTAPEPAVFQVPNVWRSYGFLGPYCDANLLNPSASYWPINDVHSAPIGRNSAAEVSCLNFVGGSLPPVPEGTDSSDTSFSQNCQQQFQQQQLRYPVSYNQHLEDNTIPTKLFGGCGYSVADAGNIVTVLLPGGGSSVMSASSLSNSAAAAASGGGCSESDDVSTPVHAAVHDQEPCSSSSSIDSNHRVSPQVHRDEGGGGEGGEEGGGPDHASLCSRGPPDRSSDDDSRPPSVLGPFNNNRRGSLDLFGASAGRSESIDGDLRFSRPTGGATDDCTSVHSHMRRSSIPCMSVTAKGLRIGAAAPHLPRPCAALDYESLKVRLEKLTGTVTDGKRKEAGNSKIDRSRRTSLVSLTHPPSGPGSVTTIREGSEGDRNIVDEHSIKTDEEGSNVQPHLPLDNATSAVSEVEEGHQKPHAYDPTDDATEAEMMTHNQTEDLSSLSSLSSSSSSSSSSSPLDKFRLQCIIEHVLKYDPRLQEILKRHQMELTAVRMKHRMQWIELGKWLTQRFGEEWKAAMNIPGLSFANSVVDENPAPFSIELGSPDYAERAGQNDELSSASLVNGQNSTDLLGTIQEGHVEDPLMMDPTTDYECRIYQQAYNNNNSIINSNNNYVLSCGRRPFKEPPKPAATMQDQSMRRCSDGSISLDQLQRPRATSMSCIYDKSTNSRSQPNETLPESRICQNIASSLARRQSTVPLVNPNSSRIHRQVITKETLQNNSTSGSAKNGLLEADRLNQLQLAQAVIQNQYNIQQAYYSYLENLLGLQPNHFQNCPPMNIYAASDRMVNAQGTGWDPASWVEVKEGIKEEKEAEDEVNATCGDNLNDLRSMTCRVQEPMQYPPDILQNALINSQNQGLLSTARKLNALQEIQTIPRMPTASFGHPYYTLPLPQYHPSAAASPWIGAAGGARFEELSMPNGMQQPFSGTLQAKNFSHLSYLLPFNNLLQRQGELI